MVSLMPYQKYSTLEYGIPLGLRPRGIPYPRVEYFWYGMANHSILGKSEWFNTLYGIRQGDSLSPTLFAVYINDLATEIY